MTGLPRQITLLLATFLTLFMNYLSQALPLFGNTNRDVSDALPNAFVPAGLTFAVWGPIFLGLLVLGIYQALPAQRTARYDTLFWPALLANLLNAGWLLAFQGRQFGLSVLVMLALLGSLIALYRAVRRLRPVGAEFWAVQVPVSLYLAGISVATMANITAFLVSLGLTDGALGLSAQAWAALLVVVAGVLGAAFLLRVRDAAFGLVLLWALYGVYAARPEALTVVVAVLLAVAVVVLAALASLWQRRAAL